MADSLDQRGLACAQFINDILNDIASKGGFPGPHHDPWLTRLDTWESLLHARGIKSQIHLFTEPARFNEAHSPIESITPASPLLERLHRIIRERNEGEVVDEAT